MIKDIQQEDITLVNIYPFNIGTTEYVKQILMDIKGEIKYSYQDSNDIFHRTRTNISKMYTEPPKAPHDNSNTEKEEQD